MTTRGSLARGQGAQALQGRVLHWDKVWVGAGAGAAGKQLSVLKWVATEERTTDEPARRKPHLVPVSAESVQRSVKCPERPEDAAAAPAEEASKGEG